MAKKIQETRSEKFESSIPVSWVMARFDDVASVTDYVANGSFASLKENVTYLNEPSYAILLRFTDYVKGWNGSYKYVDEHAYNFLHKSSVEPGDIVVANVGDPGKLFIVPQLELPMTLGPNSVLVRPANKELLTTNFLAYFLRSSWGRDLIKQITTGTAQQKFNKTGLRSTYIPIAPLEQQKRIVAKIEELFSHIDAGIDALNKAKKLLKQYRQSVLKAAVTGELTKDWREKNKDKLEPANELLERIQKERRQKWEEQQLEQFNVKGKTQKNDKWKEKYKEPELSTDKFFGIIPTEWSISSIDQLAFDVRYGSSSKTNNDELGVPVLRMGNIIEGSLDYSNLKYLPQDHKEFPELLLNDGDLIFNRTNSAELVGKTAIFRDAGKSTSLASYLIRVRFLSGIEPDFIAYVINSSVGRSWIKSCVSQNVGQANVNGTKLKAFVVPLPSADEQAEIVRLVKEKFDSSRRMMNQLEIQLLKAEKNKQSILASAFSGKLSYEA